MSLTKWVQQLLQKTVLRQVPVLLFLLLIVGCSTMTPHENFVRGVYAAVGHALERMQPGWARSSDLITTTNLENGHIAYTYKYIRTCRYTFEVNPETRIIIAARWEGSEKDCVIAP